MSAAVDLERAGKTCAIIEANNYLGGRVRTHSTSKVDLGASWCSGTVQQSVYDLCQKHSIALSVTDIEYGSLYTSTGRLSPSRMKELRETKSRVEASVERRSAALRAQSDVEAHSRVSYGELLDAAFKEEALTPETEREVRELFRSGLETLYACQLNTLSGLHFHEPPCEGKELVFPEGFTQVVDVLRKELSTTEVHTSTPVTQVQWAERFEEGCRVTTKDGKVWQGKAVIVTFSLGCLKASVDGAGDAPVFSPPLSPGKCSAIRGLGYGTLNKAWVSLSSDPCPSDPESVCMEYIPSPTLPLPAVFPFLLKQRRVGGQVTIVGLIAGELACSPSADTLVTSFKEQLKGMYGDSLPEVVDQGVVQWDKDPFFRGSYSYQTLGSHPSLRVTLREPCGSLFFGGEATQSVGMGYTHGGIDSGRRAASEVLQALGTPH